MTLEESIDKIREYYQESEDRSGTVEALRSLLRQVVSYPEHYAQFLRLSAGVGGGIFVPFLMWVELGKFLDGRGDRNAIFELVRAFAESDFEEQERELMRPLLIVYYFKEREFEISKIKAKILEFAHKDVKAYFKEIETYIERNRSSTEMLVKKMLLLRRHLPQFEYLAMSVPMLEQRLSQVKTA